MGCDHFGNHIYPLTGTVFEKTTTPLRTWFYAMYLMGSTGCGISAKQIQRETGVTYKTAWRMFTQTRLLLSDDRLQLEGSTVEMVKPTTAGSVAAIIGCPSYGSKKNAVVGIVERNTPGRIGRLTWKATFTATPSKAFGALSSGASVASAQCQREVFAGISE